ncbi:MAG TPA: hypothetical protein VFX05_01445 [Casimicrobiaceae bacterium]|nr:hypothetical protein [Casimicrobiaceae bacterium]
MGSSSRRGTCVLLALASVAAFAQGALENPQPGAVESGVGVISGWHCTSRNIEVRVDGASAGPAGAGTARADTQSVCGRADTGFSLLFNFNLLGPGAHRVEALADGVPFASATFTVGTLGAEFLTGLSQPLSVGDFPSRGTTTSLRWAQAKQNFVIEGSAATNSLPLTGNYVLSQAFVLSVDGTVISTSAPGTIVSGTMQIRADGAVTQAFRLVAGSTVVDLNVNGSFADFGHFVRATSNGATSTLALLSRGNVLTTQAVSAAGFTEVEVWTRSAATVGVAAVGPTGASPAGAMPGAALGMALGAALARAP